MPENYANFFNIIILDLLRPVYVIGNRFSFVVYFGRQNRLKCCKMIVFHELYRIDIFSLFQIISSYLSSYPEISIGFIETIFYNKAKQIEQIGSI